MKKLYVVWETGRYSSDFTTYALDEVEAVRRYIGLIESDSIPGDYSVMEFTEEVESNIYQRLSDFSPESKSVHEYVNENSAVYQVKERVIYDIEKKQ